MHKKEDWGTTSQSCANMSQWLIFLFEAMPQIFEETHIESNMREAFYHVLLQVHHTSNQLEQIQALWITWMNLLMGLDWC